MIQVERALFSNVITAVQRTANLPGGGVQGLPGGTIRGLDGVGSFGSDIQDAQKEYEKGRLRTALERVRQLESTFQGIAGRWESNVNNVLSSARTGSQQIPMQKLNEVKNAQAKMRQLARPASKALQDLVTALEIAVTNEGRDERTDDEETSSSEAAASEHQPTDDTATTDESTATEPRSLRSDEPEYPDSDLLGQFATNYTFSDRLTIKKDAQGKARVTPALEPNKFYFFQGVEPPRVLRVREVQRASILVFDAYYAQETSLDTKELKPLLQAGIWLLTSK